MSDPLISVVTINYNYGRYIARAVESVVRQTHKEWEHIVVDYGSSDNSLQVLEAAKHRRLRVISTTKCGLSEARNIAVRKARGELVAVLDADDYMLPTRLGLQLAVLNADPTLAAVGGGITIIDQSGRRHPRFFPTSSEGITFLLEAGINAVAHSALTFRRAAFEAAGGYSCMMDIAEDYDLLLRMTAKGPIRNVGQPVAVYVQHAGSVLANCKASGRDQLYYTTFALVLHSLHRYGHVAEHSASEIQSWLDGLRTNGIRNVLYRLAVSNSLRALRRTHGRVLGRMRDRWSMRCLGVLLIRCVFYSLIARSPKHLDDL